MGRSRKITFYILYAVGILGAAIIGFFSNSYFAYDKFNSYWADILYILFVAMLFITAFADVTLSEHTLPDVIVNGAEFLGGLVFLLLLYYLGGVFVFIALIYAAVILILIGIRFAFKLRREPEAKADAKKMLVVCFLMLFPMMALLGVEFADGSLWAWALIPAFVIFIIACAVTYILLKDVWQKIYDTKAKRVSNAVLVCLLWFVFAYIFSAFATGTANCVFDGEPQQVEYLVLEAQVQTGSRSVTTHKIKILIDGKERWIPVSVTDYFEIEAGDAVLINYHGGALGFAYYSYYGKA